MGRKNKNHVTLSQGKLRSLWQELFGSYELNPPSPWRTCRRRSWCTRRRSPAGPRRSCSEQRDEELSGWPDDERMVSLLHLNWEGRGSSPILLFTKEECSYLLRDNEKINTGWTSLHESQPAWQWQTMVIKLVGGYKTWLICSKGSKYSYKKWDCVNNGKNQPSLECVLFHSFPPANQS